MLKFIQRFEYGDLLFSHEVEPAGTTVNSELIGH